MRKIILILSVVVVLLGLLGWMLSFTSFVIKESKYSKVIFKTNKADVGITLELADTPEDRATGMMWRESLGEFEGMLFVFDDEALRSFWMKNTLISLDMIFISKELRIVNIQKNAEPCKEVVCKSYGSVYPAKYVVEVNGGFSDKYDIGVGDEVLIPDI